MTPEIVLAFGKAIALVLAGAGGLGIGAALLCMGISVIREGLN